MTPDAHRYNALVVLFAQLQRLIVVVTALARVRGAEPDPEELTDLRNAVDVVAEARHVSASGVVTAETVERVRPLVGDLTRRMEAMYELDASDTGTQAALGAGEVYAALHLTEGTVTMGEVFGQEAWADRARQQLPGLWSARRWADAAVTACLSGSPDAEMTEVIEGHLTAYRRGRDIALGQVRGLTAMLDGRDARG